MTTTPFIPFFEYFFEHFEDLVSYGRGNFLPGIDVNVWDGVTDVDKEWNEFPHRFYKRLKNISTGLYIYDKYHKEEWLQYALRHIYMGFLEYAGYIEYKPDEFEMDIVSVTYTEHENLGIMYDT